MTITIAYALDEPGYSYTEPANVLRTPVKGGMPRNRNDMLNPSFLLAVSWTLYKTDYDAFIMMFETTLQNGSIPFFIPLIINSGSFVTHTAQFTEDGIALSKVVGFNYTIAANLEVIPTAIDTVADAAICAAYEAAHP